jgi:hypothetical protein
MRTNLPISPNKNFKYSITFSSWDEESLEIGETNDIGYEIEDEIDTIGNILLKANTEFGIYMPVSFGNWESTEPEESNNLFEKGIKKYYTLHLTNEDGTEITEEENSFISFLLSDGRYEIQKFNEYAVGGLVIGGIALGVGALITYFYFKDKKDSKVLSSNRAKSVTHTINGKDRTFPIKDAWRKEHNVENKSQKYEVPQADRYEMGGDASEYYHEVEYGEGGVARAKNINTKTKIKNMKPNQRKLAQGGDLGISKEDYFLVVHNWVYFTFNYPMGFVKDAFNSKHLEEKFSSSYERYGSVGVLMSFWANLDNENRTILSLWIKNNYFNGDKTKLMSISDDDYTKIISHWNMFCFNFPYGFIEKVFGDNTSHFEMKWVRAYESAGSTGAVNKFFTELSMNNQRLLTDWVYDNYKEMKYEEGGELNENEEELLNMVYDTLMGNKQYPQIKLKNIKDSVISSDKGVIQFTYKLDEKYKGDGEVIKINPTTIRVTLNSDVEEGKKTLTYAGGGEVGEVNSVSELYEDEFASNYPYARDMVAYFIFGDRDDNKIADAIKGKYSNERADESALSEIMLNYEYSWRYSMNEIEEETIDELGDLMNYYSDGGEAELNYSDILNVLKTKIDDSIDELPAKYESSYTFKGEEVEHESRDGFIPFTDGGYEAIWFEQIGSMYGSGYKLPTKPLDDEMNRQIDYNLKIAKESFIEKYPEIVEELGEENIDYNSLYEAGYSDEAEELSEMESNNMWDDGTIMMQITAYYYSPNNDRGIDGKHTIRLFGDVNLESPYHRKGNLDDSYNIDFTFDSIAELEEKIDEGIEQIISWFDGDMYNESTAEMKIRRMAEGGEADEDEDEDEDEYAGGGVINEISLPNSNLYLYGFGRDINGNSTIKISIGANRRFSIQINSPEFYKYTYDKRGYKLKELTNEDIIGIEKEVTNYLKEFGSKEQKSKLKIYKDEYAEGGEVESMTDKQVEKEYDKILSVQILAGDIDEDEVEELSISEKREFLKNYKDEYAEGGEVEDWMEEALESLIEETGFDDLEISMVSDNGNEFIATDDNVEYRVFKTEDDAEEKAIEQVREDMEESPENFNKDFIIGYIDGRDFFENTLNEMNRGYAEDIMSESDDRYTNRLISEMVDAGILDEDDALSENAEELAEERIEDFVNLMTEEQLNEGNNGFDYFESNFGKEEAINMVIKNNLIDIDSASRDAVQVDGIAHFLSYYDGETVYLSNDYVAYRTN